MGIGTLRTSDHTLEVLNDHQSAPFSTFEAVRLSYGMYCAVPHAWLRMPIRQASPLADTLRCQMDDPTGQCGTYLFLCVVVPDILVEVEIALLGCPTDLNSLPHL